MFARSPWIALTTQGGLLPAGARSAGLCVLLLMLGAAAAGCRGADAPEQAAQRHREEAERIVIARVNGEAITLADFEASLEALPPFLRQAIRGETAYRRYLGDMMGFTLLAQEAQRRRLDADPDVQLEVRNALAAALWRSMGDTATGEGPDDATLEAHIAAHPERFRTPDSVTILQLFTRDPARAERLRLGFALVGLVAASQSGAWDEATRFEKFTTYAERYTEDRGTAAEIGPISAADADIILPRAVLDAALTAHPGEAPQVVAQPDGVYLLMVKEHREGSAMSLLEARSRARQEFFDATQQAQREALTQELLKSVEIEVLDPAYGGALDNLRQ